MKNSSIITPRVVDGFVSRQTNLGVDTYGMDELYSPDTEIWKSKVLDLGSPKYPPQTATAPTRYWFDRSRYNNHGTIVGATWKRLPSGVWVMSFDGDDYITIPNHTAINLGNTTDRYAMWVWVKTSAAGENTILYKTMNPQPMRLSITSLGIAQVILYDGVNNPSANSLAAVTDGNWHFILGIVDRVGAKLYIYIDGLFNRQSDDTTVGDLRNTNTLYIGSKDSITSLLTGTLGELGILNRMPGASEIQQIYQVTKWRYGL